MAFVRYIEIKMLLQNTFSLFVHTSIFSSSQVFFSFFNPWETVFKTFAIKGQIKKSCKLKKIIELILFHCNFYRSLYNTYLTNKSRGAYDVSYCNFFFRVIHVPSYTDAHISLPQAFVESDVACLRTCHKLSRLHRPTSAEPSRNLAVAHGGDSFGFQPPPRSDLVYPSSNNIYIYVYLNTK